MTGPVVGRVALVRRACPGCCGSLLRGLRVARVVFALVRSTLLFAVWASVFTLHPTGEAFALGLSLLEVLAFVWLARSDPGAAPAQHIFDDGSSLVVAPGATMDPATASRVLMTRWPLRANTVSVDGGAPSGVPLFDRVCPWSATVVGAGNLDLFALDAVLWAVHAGSTVGSCLLASVLGEDWDARGAWFLMALLLSLEAAYAVERLVDFLRSATANLTLHERQAQGKLMYLRNPEGEFFHPFRRRTPGLNLVEFLGLHACGPASETAAEHLHNWRTDHLFSVFALPDHPILPPLRRTLDALRVRVEAEGLGVLSPAERRAFLVGALDDAQFPRPGALSAEALPV